MPAISAPSLTPRRCIHTAEHGRYHRAANGWGGLDRYAIKIELIGLIVYLLTITQMV